MARISLFGYCSIGTKINSPICGGRLDKLGTKPTKPLTEAELELEAELDKMTHKSLERTLTVANVKVKIKSFIT